MLIGGVFRLIILVLLVRLLVSCRLKCGLVNCVFGMCWLIWFYGGFCVLLFKVELRRWGKESFRKFWLISDVFVILKVCGMSKLYCFIWCIVWFDVIFGDIFCLSINGVLLVLLIICGGIWRGRKFVFFVLWCLFFFGGGCIGKGVVYWGICWFWCVRIFMVWLCGMWYMCWCVYLDGYYR